MKKAQKREPRIVEFTIEGGLPMWTPRSLIRKKGSGIVRQVIEAHCWFTSVIDPTSHDELVQPEILLEREYSNWTRDIDQENTNPINYDGEWRTTPMIV